MRTILITDLVTIECPVSPMHESSIRIEHEIVHIDVFVDTNGDERRIGMTKKVRDVLGIQIDSLKDLQWQIAHTKMLLASELNKAEINSLSFVGKLKFLFR